MSNAPTSFKALSPTSKIMRTNNQAQNFKGQSKPINDLHKTYQNNWSRRNPATGRWELNSVASASGEQSMMCGFDRICSKMWPMDGDTERPRTRASRLTCRTSEWQWLGEHERCRWTSHRCQWTQKREGERHGQLDEEEENSDFLVACFSRTL